MLFWSIFAKTRPQRGSREVTAVEIVEKVKTKRAPTDDGNEAANFLLATCNAKWK